MSLLFINDTGSCSEFINDEGNPIPVVRPDREDFDAVREVEEELANLGYLEDGEAALLALESIVKERMGHRE